MDIKAWATIISLVVMLLGMFGGGVMAYGKLKDTSARTAVTVVTHDAAINGLEKCFLEQSIDLTYIKEGQKEMKLDVKEMLKELRQMNGE